MENRITYEDKLNIDAEIAEFHQFLSNFSKWNIYCDKLYEINKQLLDNLKTYAFSKVKICADKIVNEISQIQSKDYYSRDENEKTTLTDYLESIKTFCDDLIKKGFDNYQEEDVELTEKEKLKLQKQRADFRLKEIQEENAPYLSFSIGLSLVLISFMFFCIPTFFNPTVIYHVCGMMLALGVFLLLSEVNVRQSLGWSKYSDKITSKRAFIMLLKAIAGMIPLSVLFYFFSNILIIKILFFIQVWFCSTLMINGITLLTVTNLTKNKEKKFNIWNFILGLITIAGFAVQMLQLFKVL